MAQTTKTTDGNERTAPEGSRRPYEAPAVVSSDEFETLALACGKNSTAIPTCTPPLGTLTS